MNALKDSDFPNIFIASNDASLKSQNLYLIYTKVELILLILAACLAVYSYSHTETKQWLNVVSGLILLATLIITIVIRHNRFEKFWYEGRALAESVKTISWRYMTRSETFETGEGNVDKIFIDRITELKDEFNSLVPVMKNNLLSLPFITQKMKDVRDATLDERINHYRLYRIQDQINWYSRKAEFNRNLSNQYFWLLIISQALAIIASVYIIVQPKTNFNFVGLFTTIAASLLTWIQVKKYNELNTAYSTTNIELVKARDTMSTILDENAFAKFVLDAENAVSREHTTWLAQRR
ncbi:DUF4231 domain-containing protein [Neolewinella aquimaris]|nr:DUF4231 domain-containing protein [Neolewinella aquimaris]